MLISLDFLKASIKVGQTEITLYNVILFLAIILGSFVVSKYIRKVIKSLLIKEKIAEKKSYPVLKLIHYIIILIGTYLAFNVLGFPLTGLLAAAGVLGIILGFGLQSITSNMIAGLILMGEGTISIGDIIEVENTLGEVVETRVRSTTIRTFDNLHKIIPNQDFFTKSFTNYSYKDEKVRLNLEVGVAYGTNTDVVKDLLAKIAVKNEKVLEEPEPKVFFAGFGESSMIFEFKCWIKSPLGRKEVTSQLYSEIEKRFEEENITIPFPQRDLWFKN
ncbi:MAG: Small-conductance mechanosensitive channel, MscC family [Candidatus Methanohalarchaeum thermophilum]|uniref:Small-conductance mechanosensitive channel, MscC family n=1 Tax=Methanohalarchaeum thermophilum TaxID=1903181 RepID=A0A1Q6DSB5_METT1|nr:MAG: Small-conductance mechanosensitive channel, MscC family [Candidatus Methanohalarchaeum thermophilum]